MILRHIKVDCPANHREKMEFLWALYKEILNKDSQWHYWLDEKFIVLRVARKYEELVLTFINNYRDLRSKKSFKVKSELPTDYDPAIHERRTITILGNLCIEMFHIVSVASIQCRDSIMWEIFAERMLHAIANHQEIDHFKEAVHLSQLALSRARVSGEFDK